MDHKIKDIIENYQAQPYGNQRHYSVLLPLIDVDGQTHVLYEVRSHKISQPGETSFPGGRVEENEDFATAAVRETTEELNINAEAIEVIGAIDYVVNDWAIIYCYVGRLNVKLEDIQPNEEVERIFTIPLDFLLKNEPKYYTIRAKSMFDDEFPFHLIPNGPNYQFRHQVHKTPFYNLPSENLWGYTANLTHRFSRILLDGDFLEGDLTIN